MRPGRPARRAAGKAGSGAVGAGGGSEARGRGGARAGAAPRIAWLDGLRGVAAVQVVLLHYASAFLPAIGLVRPDLIRYGWERWFIHTPLYFLVDGSYAVYVFFLLSGVALTLSFRGRPRAVGRNLARRVVRLGVPMAVAVALGAGLLALWPDAHGRAAALTGSHDWLGVVSPHRVTPGMVLHQVALEGMLAGYADISLLPARLAASLHLAALTQSVDAPLWTLHLEFAGSVLVLLLVLLRSLAGPLVHRVACLLLLVCLGASPMALFVLGHLSTQVIESGIRGRWLALLGAALLGLGVALDTHGTWPAVVALQGRLPVALLGPPEVIIQFESMLGGTLVFVGVALLPVVQCWLRSGPAQWLGRVSFGLYLVHFPLLFTVASALFVRLAPLLPFGAAAGIASLVGVGLSVPAAMAFARWVDRPAVRLSHVVAGWVGAWGVPAAAGRAAGV